MIFWSWGRKKHCPPPPRPEDINEDAGVRFLGTELFCQEGRWWMTQTNYTMTCSPEILDLKLIDGATENCQCWLALKQGSSHNSRSTKGGWRTGLGCHKNSTRFGIHHQPFGIFDLQRPSTSHRFDQAGLGKSSCHHSSRSFV